MFSLSRRAFLCSPAVAVLLRSGQEAVAADQPATMAEAPDIDAMVAEQFGPLPVKWGKIRLDPTPLKGESAAMVRFTVIVDHPMEADNYIRSIAVFVEKNPSPFSVRYNLTPRSGKAEVDTTLKMVASTPVRVIAATNKGELYGLRQSVEVNTSTACVG